MSHKGGTKISRMSGWQLVVNVWQYLTTATHLSILIISSACKVIMLWHRINTKIVYQWSSVFILIHLHTWMHSTYWHHTYSVLIKNNSNAITVLQFSIPCNNRVIIKSLKHLSSFACPRSRGLCSYWIIQFASELACLLPFVVNLWGWGPKKIK